MRPFSNTRLRLIAVAAGFAISAGCGGFRSGEAAGDIAARLYFSNESLDETAVYAVSGIQQIRIGTVMAGRTDTLVVPPALLGNGTVRLVARPLGRSIAVQSGPVPLHAGEELSVRLPLNQNTLVVLPP